MATVQQINQNGAFGSLNVTGATQTGSLSVNNVPVAQRSSITGTFTGPNTTASVTITFDQIGNAVVMRIPAGLSQATSTVSTYYSFSASIPSALRPTNTKVVYSWPCIVNGSAVTTGALNISNTGAIQIFASLGGASFTSGQTSAPVILSIADQDAVWVLN